MQYDPLNWYWLAADGRVWSSAASGLVAANDAVYLAWLSAGNHPTLWPSDSSGAQTAAALQEVLTPYGLWVDLKAYANAKQWAKARGGYVATINGAEVRFSTSTESRGLISSKVARLQQPNPPATVQWQTGTDSFVSIPAADFVTVSIAIDDFVQGTFDKLATALAGVNAGTITTFAQVDAALA